VDAWLSERADALAEAAGVPRETLELDAAAMRDLLDMARIAAHESGQRTNAPLLCYLLGRAEGEGHDLHELAEAVRRSTS
jgi:hypothetical protein